MSQSVFLLIHWHHSVFYLLINTVSNKLFSSNVNFKINILSFIFFLLFYIQCTYSSITKSICLIHFTFVWTCMQLFSQACCCDTWVSPFGTEIYFCSSCSHFLMWDQVEGAAVSPQAAKIPSPKPPCPVPQEESWGKRFNPLVPLVIPTYFCSFLFYFVFSCRTAANSGLLVWQSS